MGAYRKELKYGTLEIIITESEIKYNTPKQNGLIPAMAVTGIEIQEAKFLSFGHLQINTTTEKFSIEFPKKFNTELKNWKNDFDTGKYKVKEKVPKGSKITVQGKEISAHTERNELISAVYNVIGKNPETGRKKTRQVIRSENASETEIEKASGLLPPYEISRVKDEAPTEAQIKYAQKLGITFPSDATIRDASLFLTRIENHENLHQKGTIEWLLDIYINQYGIYIPRYANAKESHRAFYHGMSKQDQIEYFVMRVYNECKGTKYMFPFEAEKTERKIFQDFIQKYIEDKKFMDSFLKYTADDLPMKYKVMKKLKAYEIVKEYLEKVKYLPT